jgi:hypothetical protein
MLGSSFYVKSIVVNSSKHDLSGIEKRSTYNIYIVLSKFIKNTTLKGKYET